MNNYPNGINDLVLRGVPITQAHPNKVFWVGDGDTAGNTPALKGRKTPSDGNDGSYMAPFKTLDYAVGRCTADAGNVIYVLPGYIDTLVAADEIDVDVDGVTIIGVGSGDKQPLIQFDNAAATFAIDADNVTVMGLNFAASVTVVAKGVDVKDGADDFHIAHCRFTTDSSGTAEFEDALFVTTSDRGVIERNIFKMGAGTDADSAIHLVGACLGCTIKDNYVEGDYTVGCIESVTAAQQTVVIESNTLMNGVHGGLNTVGCISLFTGSTGVIQNNTLYTNVSSPITAAISADACFQANNSIANTAESPVLEAETLGRGTLEATVSSAIEVEETGEGEQLFFEGPVDVYGIFMVLSAAADAGSDAGPFASESGVTFMTAGEVEAGDAIADRIYTAELGGAATVAEATATTTPLWTNPIRMTGTEDALDTVFNCEGTAGHGNIWCIWSPVTASAEVTNTE